MKKIQNNTAAKIIALSILFAIAFDSELSYGQTIDHRCETPPTPLLWGPWDYRSNKDKLPLVERAHFTPEVEALIRGKSTTNIAQDISYTLVIFPNHHRALNSLIRYSERIRSEHPPGSKYSVDCFLRRAVDFRQDDSQSRILYASYLAKNGKANDAREQLKQIESSEDDEVTIVYNLGLIYLDLKDYDKALHFAHKAYRQGFPLPGLKNRLMRAGKWQEIKDNLESTTHSTN